MQICMLDVQPHQLFGFLHRICILSRLSILKRKLKYAPCGFTSRYVPSIKVSGLELDPAYPVFPAILDCM
uniref:Uncharacterized protein n=1 Tax=Triticum urartu TaxID=4572 RepID=A0A8R7Q2Z4_TRIUA